MEPRVVLALALLSLSVGGSHGYCWAAGKNPGFTGPPTVTQVAIDRVRVSWEGLVKMPECADNYVVKYWQRLAPNNYHLTELVAVDRTSVDVEVIPKVVYQFQAVAREDKGVIGGVDWNKSPDVSFQTSSYGGKSGGSSNPSKYPFPDTNNVIEVSEGEKLSDTPGGEVVYPSSNRPDGASTHVLGMTVEVFVIFVVVCLILLLIIVGIIYRMVAGNKRITTDEDLERSADDEEEDEDDEEDEDEEEEEEEKLSPEKRNP